MPDPIAGAFAAALTDPLCFGQIVVHKINRRFALSHRDDDGRNDLQTFRDAHDAIEIAKYDDAGDYRALKTAPNLRHGWRLDVVDLTELQRALDYFYPGRLAVFAAWKQNRLTTTPLRDTLDRQSGMYRVASKISEPQIDDVVANFCRSDGGCVRTILWKRDERGTIASTKLPKEKFDCLHDQTGRNEPTIPLLCQEACNLLVAECRKVVKGE
jgi:sirohydrochlorin cobaltochelatase